MKQLQIEQYQERMENNKQEYEFYKIEKEHYQILHDKGKKEIINHNCYGNPIRTNVEQELNLLKKKLIQLRTEYRMMKEFLEVLQHI